MPNPWNQTIFQASDGNLLPEDADRYDMVEIRQIVNRYMDEKYPPFEPEIIHATDKDYYLPALKVLIRNERGLFSPQRVSEWVDGELVAECNTSPHIKRSRWLVQQISAAIYGYSTQPGNTPGDEFELVPEPQAYSFPHDGCSCGIYGTVNLDEIDEYLREPEEHNFGFPPLFPAPEGKRVLCVIEPTVDADVVMSRKGWRAGAAFVSEILGETMSIEDASNLLSIAWHHKIDLRQIDLRRLKHENR